jgi:UrcA family protein
MSRSVPLVVVALVISAASGSVSAQTGHPGHGSPVVIRVPVGDLDLNRQAGADALLNRVVAAASRACSGQSAEGIMAAQIARAYRACQAEALEHAAAAADSPMVRQRYAARTGSARVQVAQAKP